jgi:DNA-binding PadR family transcriptional regulator
MGGFRRRLGLEPGWRPTGRFFAPGELRLALLALLCEKVSHGYELMVRLEERCGGAYHASAGSIYPTLQQLEDEGLVKAELVEGKKTFVPTVAGRKEVDAHGPELERIWARAGSWSDFGLFQKADAAEIIGPALRLAKAAIKAVKHAHHDPEVIDAVRDILVHARAQIERIGRKRK